MMLSPSAPDQALKSGASAPLANRSLRIGIKVPQSFSGLFLGTPQYRGSQETPSKQMIGRKLL
jgi:hypothetical protein